MLVIIIVNFSLFLVLFLLFEKVISSKLLLYQSPQSDLAVDKDLVVCISELVAHLLDVL